MQKNKLRAHFYTWLIFFLVPGTILQGLFHHLILKLKIVRIEDFLKKKILAHASILNFTTDLKLILF